MASREPRRQLSFMPFKCSSMSDERLLDVGCLGPCGAGREMAGGVSERLRRVFRGGANSTRRVYPCRIDGTVS
jgi:hypothetical protein